MSVGICAPVGQMWSNRSKLERWVHACRAKVQEKFKQERALSFRSCLKKLRIPTNMPPLRQFARLTTTGCVLSDFLFSA